MSSSFLDLRAGDGTRVLVNTTYITQVTPTHGADVNDGVDVVFMTFGEDALSQISVPASKVGPVLSAINEIGGKFVDLKAVDGNRIILNAEYITHVAPTHGSDFADGADVTIWGATVSVPASAVSSVLSAVGIAS